MDLNTYGIYISIKNQRTSPIKVSSIDLMRAESHDRLSIANGCSRDVVLSHVSAIQKHVFHPKSIPKKKERTLDFNRYKTPPTVLSTVKSPSHFYAQNNKTPSKPPLNTLLHAFLLPKTKATPPIILGKRAS